MDVSAGGALATNQVGAHRHPIANLQKLSVKIDCLIRFHDDADVFMPRDQRKGTALLAQGSSILSGFTAIGMLVRPTDSAQFNLHDRFAAIEFGPGIFTERQLAGREHGYRAHEIRPFSWHEGGKRRLNDLGFARFNYNPCAGGTNRVASTVHNTVQRLASPNRIP